MQMQKLLNVDKRLSAMEPLTVDGSYGPKTTAAVKALQEAADWSSTALRARTKQALLHPTTSLPLPLLCRQLSLIWKPRHVVQRPRQQLLL